MIASPEAMQVHRIRMIVSDVDGVWTDGSISYVGESRELKTFNVRDGLAVKIAQRRGIEVVVLTSRHSEALTRRCRELGIHRVVQNAADKFEQLLSLVRDSGISLDEICYIGDDLPDLPAMAAAGLAAAPSDAAPEVREKAHWVLQTAGGRGAFRELVERLLRERGEWDAVIRQFYASTISGQNS